MESSCEQQRPLAQLGRDQVDLTYELSQGFAGQYIRRTVIRLVGKAGITSSDKPDLEQELALALCERWDRFDPARGSWNAFVATVVRRQAIKLLEARHRRKRIAGFRANLLSTSVIGPDGKRRVLERLIEPRHLSALTCHYAPSEVDRSDLRSDLATVIASLPWPLRRLCFWLQHETMAELARRNRRSRTALYRQLAQVRKAFAEAGLQEFLLVDRTT
jgi:DNA-directed RNA polymerase specialized sigma24 family protein